MKNIENKFRLGVTLIELMLTLAMSTIIVSGVGFLIYRGNKIWVDTYESEHSKMKQDAQAVTLAFGSIGRKTNRLGYVIYEKSGGTFTPALPMSADMEVVAGDAIEFRYWDVELDEVDSEDLINITKKATAYALFYLDDDKLKVDYGPYPPGGVPEGGGGRNTTDSITTVLAENVTADPNIAPFSHTTLNGVGQGSVRINILLTNPENGERIRVMTATLLRNIWPR